MAQRKVALALAGLYILLCQVWAKLEVSMEDRIEVFLDDVAEIPCIYEINGSASSPTIQWFVKSVGRSKVRLYQKDDSGAIVERDTGFSGRINVSYSQEGMMRSSILTINAVRVFDVQDFICQVNVEGSIEEGHTRLLVFNAPSFPVIEAETYASVADALTKIATCEVRNGFPTPKITWYKGRTPLYTSEDVDVKNRLTVNSNGLYTVHSELYLTVVKEDIDAQFYCEVTYFVPGAEKMIESKQINITVHYPTSKVTVFRDSPQHLVKEGDTVEIRCEGDGNPQPVKTFTHNNEELSNSFENMVVLHNVTRKNSGLYECSSLDTTTYESIVGNLTLMVHFLDPIVITPENPYSLDEGQDLSLNCNALSSLPTHAFWYKDDVLLKEDNVLTLNNASFATAGKYLCEIVALELPELKRNSFVQVSVRGKPMITEGVAVIPLDTEKAINVSCRATGHPTPTIQWSLSDEQAQLGRWDTRTENSVLSVISISTTSDITASCTATNALGTTETSRQIQAIQTKQTTATETATTPTTTPTTTTTTTTTTTRSNTTGTMGGNGYIIAIIIIFILLLAVLGSVLYFMYKKGKIACGRSGKQDLTKEKASSDDIVVEMKSSKSEEAVLLQGVNGDRKTSRDQ
ncbi:melanoma cell adhesion molecule b isoform X1 [Tachysurus fulvidraco]|uniref:melanoma cell adhesion molecule b isoform X1 n=1 Tax=Tachysurus fulvidraco TaxID=1234273 RepID=UPI000F4F9CF1|nr:melanoma cell adhesion molecule b isoform X1 [Tachysurus fulvidraco]